MQFDRPMMLPTDRSTPPVRMTLSCPTPASASGVAPFDRVRKPKGERISGCPYQ